MVQWHKSQIVSEVEGSNPFWPDRKHVDGVLHEDAICPCRRAYQRLMLGEEVRGFIVLLVPDGDGDGDDAS